MSQELEIYADVEDSISTLDSYRGSIIIREDAVLIPLINLGIIDHVLNPTDQVVYIDFSYLFCKGFSKLQLDSFTDPESRDKRYCYIGGSKKGDLEVECERVYLLLASDRRLSSTIWVPTNTPYSRPNLDLNQVNNFWYTVDGVWEIIDKLS